MLLLCGWCGLMTVLFPFFYFIWMYVGFSCPSLRQQAWLICWSRKAPSPSLHQRTMPLTTSLERTLICSKVSAPTEWTHLSGHLTFWRKILISITSWKHVGLVLPLTGDVNALRVILLYHFSNGVFINGGLEGGVTNLLKTLQGNNLQVLSVCAINHHFQCLFLSAGWK